MAEGRGLDGCSRGGSTTWHATRPGRDAFLAAHNVRRRTSPEAGWPAAKRDGLHYPRPAQDGSPVATETKGEYAARSSLAAALILLQQSVYDYRYDDEDTVFNEIEEFYSYVEVPQVAENMKAWQGSFTGGRLPLVSAVSQSLTRS